MYAFLPKNKNKNNQTISQIFIRNMHTSNNENVAIIIDCKQVKAYSASPCQAQSAGNGRRADVCKWGGYRCALWKVPARNMRA